MKPYGMRIAGIAAYAPPTIVTNDDIAARLQLALASLERAGVPVSPEERRKYETNDAWVRRFIGFTQRRFVGPGEGTIDLAVRASINLLRQLDRAPGSIEAIVFGTVTPSYPHSPPDSAMLQDYLGIPVWENDLPRDLPGIDLSLACSTWVAGLHTAYTLLSQYQSVLLVGADAMSSAINWHDRAFACVLGDAGTATLCERVPTEEDWFGPERFFSWLDGSRAEVIRSPMGGSRDPDLSTIETLMYANRLSMDGPTVRKDMVPFIAGPATDAALRKADLDIGTLDAVVLHEANRVLNREIALGLTRNGFSGPCLDSGGEFGNTTSASIPLAIALNPDALSVGSTIALIAFGGGYSARYAIPTIRHPFPVWTEI